MILSLEICPTRGHPSIFGYSFSWYNLREVLLASGRERPGILLNILDSTGWPHATEQHMVQNVNNSQTEKSCPKSLAIHVDFKILYFSKRILCPPNRLLIQTERMALAKEYISFCFSARKCQIFECLILLCPTDWIIRLAEAWRRGH